MKMQILLFFVCIICTHLLTAQNIESGSKDAEGSYNADANILSSEQNTQNFVENLADKSINNNDNINLNNKNYDDSSKISNIDGRHVNTGIRENSESNDEGVKGVDGKGTDELPVDEGPSTLQTIQQTLLCLAESMLPDEVVAALKSTEVNLLLHAILNTIFIVVVFVFSLKVFLGGAAKFDVTALNDELSKLQLESVRLEQEKTDISSKIKEALVKVKNAEKDEVMKEKEEAERKLMNIKKDKESVENSLSFLQQEVCVKEGKLKAQVEKQDRICCKNKNLETELKEVNEKIKCMQVDVETKSKELQEIEEVEGRLKEEVETLQANLIDLQDTQSKATRDVSELMKRANDLEIENALLLERESNNAVSLEKKEREEELLNECFQSLNNLQSQTDNEAEAESQTKNLQEYVSTDIVGMRLCEGQRQVSSLQKALQHEQHTGDQVKEALDRVEGQLESKREGERVAKEGLEAACIKMKTLSEYFKQKEGDLNIMLKGLDMKDREMEEGVEGNEGKLERLNRLSAEYKSQVDVLQREIQEVESNFRKEVASLERKAHENWLSYRQSERETKDATAELNSLQAKISEAQAKLDEWYEANQKLMPEPRIRPPFPIPPSFARRPPLPGFPPPPPHHFPPPHSIFPPPPPPSSSRNSRNSHEPFFSPVNAPENDDISPRSLPPSRPRG